jgi:hypothetical protein
VSRLQWILLILGLTVLTFLAAIGLAVILLYLFS